VQAIHTGEMTETLSRISASLYARFHILDLGDDGYPPQPLYTLVDENGNILFETHDGRLLDAILRNNDVDALIQYVTRYPEITKPAAGYRGDIFYLATARGGVDVLRALLQYYASNANTMQPPNERGFLFLNIACKYCRVDTVRLLLEDYPEYTDIHGRAERGESAILAAAQWSGFNIDNEASHRDEIMHMLLDKGASAEDFSQWLHFPTEVTIELGQPIENVLTLAVPWASPGLIRRLIDKGADPNEKTYTYSTNDRAVTEKKVVTSGVTALFVASIYWNVEVVEILLRHHKSGDDAAELVSRCDSYGRLPLHWAAGGSKEGFHPNLIQNPNFNKRVINTLKLLVESNPTTVNARDHDGETPLHYATHSFGRLTIPYKGVFQYFLDNDADASIQNREGRTPFQFLCDRFNDGIPLEATTMSLLFTESEDLSHADADGNTCLHKLASQWDRVEAVKFLLERGANVAIKNLKGNTPLHEAANGRYRSTYIPPEKAQREFDRMMNALLQAGDDRVMNIKNTSGKTAREIFEQAWIKRSSVTMPDRDDLYPRGFAIGRGKNPIHPVGISLSGHR
jgi:ankyrin repeat protein